ncbi:MAG: energy transducer TonB [Candidatus Acidiferrales bacterium]
MREEKHLPEKFVPLSHCLMESDAETTRLARRTRRRSMLLSTAIEAALLVAAVVIPLFASSKLSLRFSEPGVPYSGNVTRVAEVKPENDRSQRKPPQRRPTRLDLTFQPPNIPKDTPKDDHRDSMASDSDSNPIGTGPQIPGTPNLFDPGPQFFERSRIHTPPPPVPQPKPRGLMRVSEGVQAAKLIYRVEPKYPPLALQTRRNGKVELRAMIGADGTMRELEVVSGEPLFVQAALDAVRQWRYSPTLLSGQAVEVHTHITVIFKMGS